MKEQSIAQANLCSRRPRSSSGQSASNNLKAPNYISSASLCKTFALLTFCALSVSPSLSLSLSLSFAVSLSQIFLSFSRFSFSFSLSFLRFFGPFFLYVRELRLSFCNYFVLSSLFRCFVLSMFRSLSLARSLSPHLSLSLSLSLARSRTRDGSDPLCQPPTVDVKTETA